jgi:hypothetical protein
MIKHQTAEENFVVSNSPARLGGNLSQKNKLTARQIREKLGTALDGQTDKGKRKKNIIRLSVINPSTGNFDFAHSLVAET